MDTLKLINEYYAYAKKTFGNDEQARKLIALVITRAIDECSDDNIAQAIHQMVKNDHDAFVKKKEAA